MPQPHAHDVDKDADDEEAQADLQHLFGDGEEAVHRGIHESIGIEMTRPVRHDGEPRPQIDEGHIERRIDHPGEHGVPVHVPLVDKENIVDGHEDRDEVVENVIVKREVLVADIIQPVRANRARTDDQMIHERECRKARCHAEAAVRRVQEGDIHLKQRRSQPKDEEGEGGKGVVLDPRPEYKGRQHLVLHEKDQSHDQEDEDRPAIHQCNRHTHLAWKKRHRRLNRVVIVVGSRLAPWAGCPFIANESFARQLEVRNEE